MRRREKEYLLNEKRQVYIRIAMYIFFATVLPWMGLNRLDIGTMSIPMEGVVAAAFSINAIYFYYILKNPFKHQRLRIFVMVTVDVLFTIFAMCFAQRIGAYFAGILLWYIVGYGMRYDRSIAYGIYALTLFSWILLYFCSPYWSAHPEVYLGWFITYLIIPLYYFRLLSRLRTHMDRLYEDVENNTFKATHDPLTQLPNRFSMAEKTQKLIDSHTPFALLFIDLDGFKKVNDRFGHDAGDRVLIEVSKRLLREDVYVARMGGDEFAAIIESDNPKRVARLAKETIESIEMPYTQEGVEISASIGIALFPSDGTTEYQLKKQADEAMYKAKFSGKGHYRFYSTLKKEA